MKKIVVKGGIPLHGEVAVSGSKNAALPIIFACIIANGVSRIDNLPDIGDVRVALDILRGFGAQINREGERVIIDTGSLHYCTPRSSLVSGIRASTYLIGACLARFGRCEISSFGGCNFSHRPIDMHLAACRAMGAEVGEYEITASRLRGTAIDFDKPSVGATVNSLLLSVSAEGETRIRGFAREPHIDALIDFLLSCGAEIRRTRDEIIVVGRSLHGGCIRVIGDMIEAGSYLAAGYATGGIVDVADSNVEGMEIVIDVICGAKNGFTEVTASPYPGFPTDLQPVAASLMAVCTGGKITDTVWPHRFGYLNEISKFGVKFKADGNNAVIFPSKINCAEVTAPDLRGGFACLMCALAAEGESKIYSAEIILRGYERLVEKLRAIGAEIRIEEY